MKVQAIAKGFFGSLREVGDEFEVPGGTTASWFTPLAPADAEPEPKPRKGRPKAAGAEPDEAGDDPI